MGTWREQHLKTAWTERYQNAQQDLANEQIVLSYLQEQGKDGAAKRVEQNLIKLEQRVQRIRRELPGDDTLVA